MRFWLFIFIFAPVPFIARSLFFLHEHPHGMEDIFRIIDAEINPYSKEKFTMKRQINLKITKGMNISELKQVIM